MDKLTLLHSKMNGMDMIEVSGEIDVYNSFEFKKIVEDLIDAGSRRIIVDLEKVHYVDSSGLGALINQRTKMQKAGGDLFLVRISDQIRSVLELTKMAVFFKIYKNPEEVMEMQAAS
ncbi:MAG: STAS domain-containing protein [Spirochaetia bacterium]|nr:STAS domain-containing protein [Spirochaetia bacterium]